MVIWYVKIKLEILFGSSVHNNNECKMFTPLTDVSVSMTQSV